MNVKELVGITTRRFGGKEHGAVSVNVSPNCDSDSYAEMWSNAIRIGCDYVTFDSL